MRITKITLLGRIPSKKNSKNIIFNKKTGHRMIIPSAKYTEWEYNGVQQIEALNPIPVNNVKEVILEFYMPDNRRADLTNKAESVMDLLVKTGMIIDDAWQYIPRVLLHCEGIDRKNPRVNIQIKEGIK